MRAMILAAGLGTRLRPLTQACPKPLLPLMLQPMLGHLLDQLHRQGVREVAINLHHRAAQLRGWIEDNQWEMRFHLSHEPEILGTAGGMKAVQAFLRQAPFLVINADVLANFDVRALWQWHCDRQALVTMVVRPDPAAREYGPVWVDTADRVLQINGRPQPITPVPGQETMFTGIQMVSPEVLDRIPPGRFSSTTADVYPALVAETRAVYGYRHRGYWMDVGVPRRYLQAHWDMLNGALGDQWLDRLPPGSVAMLKERIVGPCRPSASLIPPVVLGARAELSAGACIGPYAVLGAGCRVETGAVIRNSVLWEDVQVAAAATIDQSILGTGVRVPGASVWREVIRTL